MLQVRLEIGIYFRWHGGKAYHVDLFILLRLFDYFAIKVLNDQILINISQVGHHNGNSPLFTSQFQGRRVFDKRGHDFGREVAAEHCFEQRQRFFELFRALFEKFSRTKVGQRQALHHQ